MIVEDSILNGCTHATRIAPHFAGVANAQIVGMKEMNTMAHIVMNVTMREIVRSVLRTKPANQFLYVTLRFKTLCDILKNT